MPEEDGLVCSARHHLQPWARAKESHRRYRRWVFVQRLQYLVALQRNYTIVHSTIKILKWFSALNLFTKHHKRKQNRNSLNSGKLFLQSQLGLVSHYCICIPTLAEICQHSGLKKTDFAEKLLNTWIRHLLFLGVT